MIVVRSFQSRVRSSAVAVLVASGIALAAVALGGCGGAAPEAAAPSAKTPESARSTAPEPGSIEEAQAQIASARAQLGGNAGPNRFAPAPGAAPAPEAAPMSPGSTSGPTSSPPPPPSADSSAASGGGDRCASPCRALASMRRAVNALCRMTGNDDARCTDANQIVLEKAHHSSC